ncbi:hypothetical protein ACHWQZ_G013251 [Mnemiopsis leidyi]
MSLRSFLMTLFVGVSLAQTDWVTPTLSEDTVTSNGIYWHRSDRIYEIRDSFQPTINFTGTGLSDFTGNLLQCNLQLFAQTENGTEYVGILALIAVVSDTKFAVQTTRGFHDHFIDIPGCGAHILRQSIARMYLSASGNTFSITWNIKSFASADCPKVFGAIVIVADQVEIGSFNISYRYTNWYKDKRRRRRAASRIVGLSNSENSLSYLASADGMTVKVY